MAEGDTDETTFRREEEQDDQEDDGGLYSHPHFLRLLFQREKWPDRKAEDLPQPARSTHIQ